MAKKPRIRRTRSEAKLRRARHDTPSRSALRQPSPPTAEVATVAWMLAMLATCLAEVLGILIRVLSLRLGASNRLQMLSGSLLLVAVLAGLVTLLLTPITLRLRPIPPPRPIVVTAVIVGAIPLVTVLILAWR